MGSSYGQVCLSAFSSLFQKKIRVDGFLSLHYVCVGKSSTGRTYLLPTYSLTSAKKFADAWNS